MPMHFLSPELGFLSHFGWGKVSWTLVAAAMAAAPAWLRESGGECWWSCRCCSEQVLRWLTVLQWWLVKLGVMVSVVVLARSRSQLRVEDDGCGSGLFSR